MMTRRRFLAVVGTAIAAFPLGLQAQTPAPCIWGFVFSQREGGRPLGGVTVSLAHPAVGRASPSVTDYYGRYAFYGLPPRPDPYYIEAYWGQQLLFRGMVNYAGPTVQFNIPLP